MNEYSYSLLRWTDPYMYPTVEADDVNLSYLYGSKKIDEREVPLIKLRFCQPPPLSPVMGDYHPVLPVFSEKIANLVRSYKFDYIQIFPAIINGIGHEKFQYFYVYIANKIRCLDFDKSLCIKTPEGAATNLQKIVLDTKVLEKISLQDRRIFKLREASSKILFHQSIVEDIQNLNPTNIRFIKIEDYYDGIEFE